MSAAVKAVVFQSEESKTSEKVAPQKLAVNPDFPIDSIHVVIGVKTKDGKVEEQVYSVDGTKVQITGYTFDVKQKHQKAKDEDGNLIGFEPTGEETMRLVVSYVRNP